MTQYVILEAIISLLLVGGALFAFIGSLGMASMQDFFMRLHGPTKATTTGIGCILIGSMIYFGVLDGKPVVQELLITLFLFISAPVSAHLLGKAALHLKLERADKTRGTPEELGDDDNSIKPTPYPEHGRTLVLTQKELEERQRQ